MLVDSHCHLDFADYGTDREDVIRRARLGGVGTMLTISTKLSTFPAVRAVAERHADVFCTVGIHPHEAESEGPDADTAKLVELAKHPRVVGIGETGLDYYYEHAPRQAQADSFRAHIAASRETGLPLIVHTRDADEDMIAILGEEQGKGAFPGLLHCFSSGRAVAEAALEQGFYVSFSGILTFKNAVAVRDVAKIVPLDRLLVETDAPYLAPVPNRGKRNEPAFVAHTAAVLAELRGMTPEALADATTENFFRLFGKAAKPDAASVTGACV
ncbi:MAG TPA: TatD family hydrolase [Alphaproteobacteria bacterium]|jgi:TatD DNase family protein